MATYEVTGITQSVNITQLTEEMTNGRPSLSLAGVPNTGITPASSTSYIVHSETELTAAEKTRADAIAAAHVAIDWQDVAADAALQAHDIPGWATWNETEALAWHDTNVKQPIDDLQASIAGIGNFAQALVVLEEMRLAMDKLETENRAMARMIIALRNRTFPNLEGQNGV